MTRLQSELERLFRVPDAVTEDVALLDGNGRVVTLVVGFARSRDWPVVAALLEGLQETLGLPLPAVAVDGKAGFQLWLPLAEPIAPETATLFLAALRRQYLGDIADHDLTLLPTESEPERVRRIPALSTDSGRWSTFIDPTMGAMFADEGGLDFEPNPDRQADQLAAITPIEPADLARALAVLTTPSPADQGTAEGTPHATIGGYSEPREFLMVVMNDASVPLGLRIEAAKALLNPGRS
ncbi:MAG: hypothetical protein CVU31_09110 [Betaproteobacteria bacterium HGW-Betaproteobacteria-4]|nr:MAG: hypothetical protein CVU31_09110 [Betaproteobacteria bacterium HGW-Betaproteobacteria-4]